MDWIKCALSAWADTHLLLPLVIGTHGSRAFWLSPGITPPAPGILRPLDLAESHHQLSWSSSWQIVEHRICQALWLHGSIPIMNFPCRCPVDSIFMETFTNTGFLNLFFNINLFSNWSVMGMGYSVIFQCLFMKLYLTYCWLTANTSITSAWTELI